MYKTIICVEVERLHFGYRQGTALNFELCRKTLAFLWANNQKPKMHLNKTSEVTQKQIVGPKQVSIFWHPFNLR